MAEEWKGLASELGHHVVYDHDSRNLMCDHCGNCHEWMASLEQQVRNEQLRGFNV